LADRNSERSDDYRARPFSALEGSGVGRPEQGLRFEQRRLTPAEAREIVAYAHRLVVPGLVAERHLVVVVRG